MSRKSKREVPTALPALRGRGRMAIIFRAEEMFPDPRTPVFPRSPDPLEGTDPSKPRDVRLGERFAARYWGYRKLANFRQPGRFPDLIADDLVAGKPVTIELTELAHERDRIRHHKTERLRQNVYRALASKRPNFRGWAISVLHSQGQFSPLPNPASKEGREMVEQFVECLEDGFDRGNLNEERPAKPPDYYWRIPVDPGRYPTLSKYVREMRPQPTAPGSPWIPSPDDPILLFGSQSNIYLEGERQPLLNEAIARKARRGPGYRADILLVHTWADLYVLRGPETPEELVASAKGAIPKLGAQQRFGEVWLMDTLDGRIWRIWP